LSTQTQLRTLPHPKAVLFDLFHTLVSVPSPSAAGETPVSEILGISGEEWHRRYYDDDVLGRCLGLVRDSVEAMRRVTHSIDPTIDEERIVAAAESRSRRFEIGLVVVEQRILRALDSLRAAGIRTAIVSDAGADDVESWPRSPLGRRVDATFFSFELGFRKPDPRIYRHALTALGVPAGEAFFVGDGGSDEHAGARAVGMHTVLVTRFFALWEPDKIAARRAHADWEFEDVAAFVDALGISS
jgi:putative hydrolase of the HAD superfamily